MNNEMNDKLFLTGLAAGALAQASSVEASIR